MIDKKSNDRLEVLKVIRLSELKPPATVAPAPAAPVPPPISDAATTSARAAAETLRTNE